MGVMLGCWPGWAEQGRAKSKASGDRTGACTEAIAGHTHGPKRAEGRGRRDPLTSPGGRRRVKGYSFQEEMLTHRWTDKWMEEKLAQRSRGGKAF